MGHALHTSNGVSPEVRIAVVAGGLVCFYICAAHHSIVIPFPIGFMSVLNLFMAT